MAVQLGPLAESVHVLPGPRIQPLDAQATPTTGITVPVTRDGMRDRPTRFMVSIALGRVIQVFGPPTGPERLPMLPGVVYVVRRDRVSP